MDIGRGSQKPVGQAKQAPEMRRKIGGRSRKRLAKLDWHAVLI
jgi:hypothetical protein